MRFGPDPSFWRTLLWWLAVLAVALQLKHHYSIATVADLEWMFRPLSQLLEWLTGHSFYPDDNHEWVSQGANVRLVKACAGINFMLMSFLVYAWIVGPDRYTDTDLLSWMAGRLLLLGVAITASWATCLLANSFRIIVAMNVESHEWGLDAFGVGAADFHRLIGTAIYLPLLSLQMMLGSRSARKGALAVPLLVYLLLMVVVPLLTGNALQRPALFMRHLLGVSVIMAVMCGSAFLWRARLTNKR